MTEYTVISFGTSIELDDDMEIVAAELSGRGTRGNGSNYALVKLPETEAYVCGAELDSGGECGREVDEADARCWQHNEG